MNSKVVRCKGYMIDDSFRMPRSTSSRFQVRAIVLGMLAQLRAAADYSASATATRVCEDTMLVFSDSVEGAQVGQMPRWLGQITFRQRRPSADMGGSSPEASRLLPCRWSSSASPQEFHPPVRNDRLNSRSRHLVARMRTCSSISWLSGESESLCSRSRHHALSEASR